MNNQASRTEKAPAETPETTHGGRIYAPLTDIIETEDGISLMLEMPGVASDDVNLTLEKRVLTIRGKVRLTQSDKLRLSYAEYGEGDYERAFTLSEDFDPDRIEAVTQNGVLTVKMPRAKATQPRRIAVKSA